MKTSIRTSEGVKDGNRCGTTETCSDHCYQTSPHGEHATTCEHYDLTIDIDSGGLVEWCYKDA